MAKIRIGFVTNSSSSSFVIMYKQMSQVGKEIIEKYPFLKNYIHMIEKLIFNGDNITTIEGLNEYFVNQWGWKDQTLEEILNEDEDARGSYNQYKEKIENGYGIAFRCIDYNDESGEEMLRGLHDGVNFIIKCEN